MAKIFVTQKDNDRFFNQKLHTYRNGFCYINRKVTMSKDPYEIWDFYGTVKTPNGNKIVYSNDGVNWEFD